MPKPEDTVINLPSSKLIKPKPNKLRIGKIEINANTKKESLFD